jgi:murein DD-endopeptidase MepM/ murein hydrolase activator NlpD
MFMKSCPTVLVFLASLALLGAGCTGKTSEVLPPLSTKVEVPAPPVGNKGNAPPAAVTPHVEQAKAFVEPIDDALARVTKKKFGLKVSPKDSPVSPERFAGYHSGVDFETTPEEQSKDVPIRAACDGTLALKKFATGYGGVAVQRCTLGDAEVTVIYGHLRLTSITAKVGQTLKQGDAFAVLGTGFSKETDGERKHLHLGIHKGSIIDIKGYVQDPAALAGWIDAQALLQ